MITQEAAHALAKPSAIKYSVKDDELQYYEQCKNTLVTARQSSALLALFQLKSTIKPLKF